jgi:hypothetical protein
VLINEDDEEDRYNLEIIIFILVGELKEEALVLKDFNNQRLNMRNSEE